MSVKRHRVILSKSARWELRNSFEYIASDNPQAAKKWLNDVESALNSLKTFPNRCPLAIESRFFQRPVRNLIIGSYRIIYMVADRLIVVLHVRHVRMWVPGQEG